MMFGGADCGYKHKDSQPQFEGQTKTKLGNSEVKGMVENLVLREALGLFRGKPKITLTILDKVMEPQGRARPRGAQRSLPGERAYSAITPFPENLPTARNATPRRAKSIIVEGMRREVRQTGQKQGFPGHFAPRGKILNVEKSRFDKMLENQEIRNMIPPWARESARTNSIPKSYGIIISS